MVLRLNPRHPLVWRSPTSLQFGVDDPRVVMADVTNAAERMIAALGPGISRSGIGMVARSAGASAEELDRLLARLAPVLLDEHESPSPPTVAMTGTGRTADLLAEALRSAGVALAVTEPGDVPTVGPIDLAVLVSHFVVEPEAHGVWLRRDIPHLPIVLSDTSVRIGPMIEPGIGPCLYCIERQRTERDAAWPAIESQLWGRRSPTDRGLVAIEAAALAARLVQSRLTDGRQPDAEAIRLDAETGVRTSRVWRHHPDCACSAPRESEKEAASPIATVGIPPRSTTIAAWPA